MSRNDSDKGVNEGRDRDEDGGAEPSATGRRYARRRGDIHGQEKSSSTWLISFTDVMALMLTFFVLLFAMQNPQEDKWSEIMSAMKTEFNKFYGPLLNRGPQDAINLNKINFSQALNINYLGSLMESVVQENKYLDAVKLIPQRDRLILSLPQDLLFDSTDAAVKEEGSRALYALGGALSRIQNQVEIVGHADPRPIQGEEPRYDSNWELSLARAANVAAILESVGYRKGIIIRGAASGRYDDLAGIADEDERLGLSRRVDIVILNHDGRKTKLFGDPVLP